MKISVKTSGNWKQRNLVSYENHTKESAQEDTANMEAFVFDLALIWLIHI